MAYAKQKPVENGREREEKPGDSLPGVSVGTGRLTSRSDCDESQKSLYCLPIIGQIEGHYLLPDGQKATKYEHLIPLLVSIEESRETDGLLIILNTMGGDVEAGLALSELIASMRKPTVTLVLGGGHSIGVPLSVAGKKSFIVPSATMTIHPVRINGMVIGAPQTYRYFEDMQERITTFICRHSRISREDLHALMMRPDQMATDVGTVLQGEEAVAVGLVDEVGGLDAALTCLRNMVDRDTSARENALRRDIPCSGRETDGERIPRVGEESRNMAAKAVRETHNEGKISGLDDKAT